jgi:hypothetical protein
VTVVIIVKVEARKAIELQTQADNGESYKAPSVHFEDFPLTTAQ